MQTDILVLGAGAAGLFCAAEAARRGHAVVVVDHADAPAKKVRISGGGRCNFTNLGATHEHFVSHNPHYCRSALARYTPHDFVAHVEAHGIAWHEKTAGQLFCDGSAQQIVDMLTGDCAGAGAELHLHCEVHTLAHERIAETHNRPKPHSADEPAFPQSRNADVQPQSIGRTTSGTTFVHTSDAGFTLETSRGTWRAPRLVVATGGLSIPALGASPLGYRIAESFGHTIVPPRAALVPYTWREADRARFAALAGVSCEAIVTAGAHSFHDALLFTHRGVSGPAVLQSSLYWSPGTDIHIDLLPGIDTPALVRERRATARDAAGLLGGMLPRRIAEHWCAAHAPGGSPARWTSADIDAFAAALHAWRVTPAGTEGYRTAEVTAGGVDTAQLSSKTMESTLVPGLYFIGEVVDVTGMLGGFNFQWAWASAMAAARAF